MSTLRERKSRPSKPFAVMVADLESARRIADVSAAAAELLTSLSAPVVLLPARKGPLSRVVAPNSADVGVMLAYSPIHHLLFERLGRTPLVMTSANQGGSPIVFRDGDLNWIEGLADGILAHDRPINVACEDSVLAVDESGDLLPIRRSRGYAPLDGAPSVVLATGGDFKTTFCLRELTGEHTCRHISATWPTFGRKSASKMHTGTLPP